MAAGLREALERVETVLRRRPSAGLNDDATGTVRWDGGTRMVARHASGAEVLTDMATEFGGSGDQVSPGWLVRAGVASCTATTIVMAAARENIALSSLEVSAASRSDVRGILGMTEADGAVVYPGPLGIHMTVRIAAPGVSPERLRALVDECQRLAAMSALVRDPVPLDVTVELAAD